MSCSELVCAVFGDAPGSCHLHPGVAGAEQVLPGLGEVLCMVQRPHGAGTLASSSISPSRPGQSSRTGLFVQGSHLAASSSKRPERREGRGKALKRAPVHKPFFGDACQCRASPVELERVPVKRLRSVFEADKSLPLKCGRRAKAPSSCSCCQPLRINHSRVQIRAQSGAEHFSCQEEGSAGYRSAPGLEARRACGGRAPLRSCLFPAGGGLASRPHAGTRVAPARPWVATAVRPERALRSCRRASPPALGLLLVLVKSQSSFGIFTAAFPARLRVLPPHLAFPSCRAPSCAAGPS